MHAIYLIVDARFLKIGRAQALFLAEKWGVDVHLFIEDLSIASCDAVDHPCVFIHINEIRANLPKGLPQSSKWPIVVFSRNYVPDLLRRYDRLIYLDVDILCKGVDHSIWTLPLPAGIGAVRDVVHLRRAPLDTGMGLDAWFRAIGVSGGRYFNSGMMLIDPKKWDADRLNFLLTDYFSSRNVKAIKSQDFLNHAFDGMWTELSPRWNWQPAWLEQGLDPILRPIFVHYCNRIKPWFYPGKPGLSRQRADAEDAFFNMLQAVGVSPSEVAEEDDRTFLKRAGQALRKKLVQFGVKFPRERRALAAWQENSRVLWQHLQDMALIGGYADITFDLPDKKPMPTLWFDGRNMRELLPGDP